MDNFQVVCAIGVAGYIFLLVAVATVDPPAKGVTSSEFLNVKNFGSKLMRFVYKISR